MQKFKDGEFVCFFCPYFDIIVEKSRVIRLDLIDLFIILGAEIKLY